MRTSKIKFNICTKIKKENTNNTINNNSINMNKIDIKRNNIEKNENTDNKIKKIEGKFIYEIKTKLSIPLFFNFLLFKKNIINTRAIQFCIDVFSGLFTITIFIFNPHVNPNTQSS